jgi:hypothetical protein
MILCADSGSTKTQWLTQGNELIETIGFNPQFFSESEIVHELEKHEGLIRWKPHVTKVFFYGAGCSSLDRNRLISRALSLFFPSAQVLVDHDLKAAAYATYDGRPCISCIIGTGSNSCFFDGNEITEVIPALGYVLGDEGSGSWLGKELLRQFLYHRLPEKTERLLKEKYGADKETIFERVYRQPHPNVYLASFAKVLSETEDKAFASELVVRGFTEFFKYHICCYPNYCTVPVHFVGSLAFIFRSELQQVAETHGVSIGKIDKSPVYKLMEFHLKNV